MSNLVPGYEYDIFISYRQKDNKGDRWVSTFVESLKTELEATFKEDISIYFDENPHDRLKETHNVDKSLEGKLRCLIFIPILSQTYCDPSSFAWQHEFLAFNMLAEKDRFGRDIRLRSGNYASRILPVRIHDLDPEDVRLFEKETGEVLRAMDFVFNTATGVSRPLKIVEDHPKDNLNKIYYADQINKVAKAIKEIIQGIKEEAGRTDGSEKASKEELRKSIVQEPGSPEHEKTLKPVRKKWMQVILVTAVFVTTAILAYPKIFKKNGLKKWRAEGTISVAVMPFQNMTSDTAKNFWQEMIQDNLITSLSNSEELKVRQLESIITLIKDNEPTNYTSLTPTVARNISNKLDAAVFIQGSINKIGKTIRLNSKLIDSESDEVLKAFQVDGTADNILTIADSLSTLVKNFLVISALGKDITPDLRYLSTTKSPDAYKNFIYGEKAFSRLDYQMAIKFYLQALDIDTDYVYPTVGIFWSYYNQGLLEESKKWCLRAYEKKDRMSLFQKSYANAIYAVCYETPFDVIKYLKQTLEFDDQLPDIYTDIGTFYNRVYEYDKAIPVLKKALEIYDKWEVKPFWSTNYLSLGVAYHETGQYNKEKKLYRKAEEDFPGDLYLMRRQFILAATEGDSALVKSIEEKAISVLRSMSISEPEILNTMALACSDANLKDKAEEYYRQALALEPENPSIMADFAIFLIENNRNIDEGLKLAEAGLRLYPDDYRLLHSKGWGLYQRGQYREAKDLLQESWDIRRKKAEYNHKAFLHLEAAKKAVAGLKN
jgi:tetratricopeptide (TPR) repeat protein